MKHLKKHNTRILVATGLLVIGLLLVKQSDSTSADEMDAQSTCQILGQLAKVMAEARDELDEAGATDEQGSAAIKGLIASTDVNDRLRAIMNGPLLDKIYDDLRTSEPAEVNIKIKQWCERAVSEKDSRPGEPTKAVNISL